MSEKPSGPSISIGGNVGRSATIVTNTVDNLSGLNIGSVGRMVIGSGSFNDIFQETSTLTRFATPEELTAFANLFRTIDQEIAATVPPNDQAKAREQVEEIKTQVTSAKPDLSKLEQAKKWFVDHLPALVGGVTGILTHPIVGKIVESAGEFTLKQFRARLGLPQDK